MKKPDKKVIVGSAVVVALLTMAAAMAYQPRGRAGAGDIGMGAVIDGIKTIVVLPVSLIAFVNGNEMFLLVSGSIVWLLFCLSVIFSGNPGGRRLSWVVLVVVGVVSILSLFVFSVVGFAGGGR